MNKPEVQPSLVTGVPEGINIDIKRILSRAFQYWFLVALSLIIALSIAYFKTRYAPKIYPITASIIIKENEQPSEGRYLYNNPLVGGFSNYLNELYIIRSFPLIQQTLESINFGVAFYNEGNVLTTESYDVPVHAYVIKKQSSSNSSFYFKMLTADQYQVNKKNDENTETNNGPVIYTFGDTITFDNIRVVFSIKNAGAPIDLRTFLFTYTDPSMLTGSYVGRIGASWAEEGSGVINLSIQGSNPAKEIDFMKGLIAQYQQYNLDKKNQTAFRTIEFISDQLRSISDSLHIVENQLERFKDNNVKTDLGSQATRLYNKLEPLEAQRIGLIINGNYYKYLNDYITEGNNLDQIILPSSLGIGDAILSNLISKMIDIQLQLKMNVKQENPLIQDGRRKINEIKKDILESVKNLKVTDKIKQDYIDKQIRDLDKQLDYLPHAERKLASIQRNYSLLENLYIFLLQKKAEAGISKASTTSDIQIVNPPMLAGGPISPKPLINYMIALAAGLGLPALFFVFMEILNTKVQSKEDVEKITAIPFIGGVGHKHTINNLEVLTNPKGSITESFRALRSNLTYFLGNREKAVFMITSSISGEGKTFTSLNLASVFALSGKKTLIIGADMRKPKIFQDFGLSNDKGVSTYLSGRASFDDVVQKTENESLHFVSGGPVPPNPSELLLTEAMKIFMAEAKKRYDYVIIDTPPLAIVADAFALASFTDHTLFLVRQNYTLKGLLRTVNEFYVTGKLQNISIVLNDIYRSGPGYGYGNAYGYGFGYGYGYRRNKSKNGYGYYTES